MYRHAKVLAIVARSRGCLRTSTAWTSPPPPCTAAGQRVHMKYQRNNHGPDGFIRLTLGDPDMMMNKKEREKNAF